MDGLIFIYILFSVLLLLDIWTVDVVGGKMSRWLCVARQLRQGLDVLAITDKLNERCGVSVAWR